MNYHNNIITEHTIKPISNEPYLSMLRNILNNETIEHKIIDTEDRLSHKILKDRTMLEIDNLITQRKTLYDIVSFNIDNTTVSIKQEIMKMLYISLFIPFSIMTWIELKCDHCYIIRWDNVRIHVINDKEVEHDILNTIIKLVKWIIIISGQNKPKLNIFIYLSQCKKEIGENPILGYNEINSGVSYTDNWLQIFRKEELYKVLIHELIHNMEMDLNIPKLFDKELEIFHMHKESQPLLVNEGYVELMALYLHAIFYSDKYDKNLNEIILDEAKFSVYQINKIFKHYNIDNISYFSKKNNFIQRTNVIPYFLLKYLFLINIRYFVRYFNDKEKSIWLIKRSLKKIYQLKIPKVKVMDKSLKMIYNGV
jgi:hypothetical protein